MGVQPSRPLAENMNEYPSDNERYTDATHSPCPVLEFTPYAIPVTDELKEELLPGTPVQSIPLYEYMIEMEDVPNAPATHNPRPVSSHP
jgi:hypothetical protein